MPAHILSVRAGEAPQSFRERLQAELAQRCARNPRYSLRAFADYLGTDHATLSQMMRGKRPCTAASVRRLGARLGLNEPDIADYVAGLALPVGGATAEVRHLAEDAASVITDWRAFAILELMRLKDFQTDVRWIARMLGVEPDSVNIALQHLLRLGFLRMESPDRWLDLTGGAIYSQEAFTVLALDQAELARLLAQTERYLAEARQTGGQGDMLYQLEVHCFPLSAAQPGSGEVGQ